MSSEDDNYKLTGKNRLIIDETILKEMFTTENPKLDVIMDLP